MGVLPKKPLDRVNFLLERTKTGGPWVVNTAAVGLQSAAVTAIQTKAVAALAAFNEQQSLKAAAEAATLNYKELVGDLTGAASDAVKAIKAKAAADGTDQAYVLAQIPAPATPAPVPPPGMPTDFRTTLLPGGALEIKFKCANGRNGGVLYHVERRVGGAGSFTFLGATGQKKWTDLTVPANAGPVTYRITAARSTGAGVPNEFTVNFGVGSGGEVTASVVPAAPRIAA